MKTQEVTPVICPQCQVRYNAPVTPIICISLNPELKEDLLRGRLNHSQCPQCGVTHPVNIPFLYQDSAKELALVYIPTNLNLSHTDEQKIIGDYTNRVLTILPPEERKGYLFTPQTFLTFDSLVKTILAADGITEEMLQAQQTKLLILDKLLQAHDETDLRHLVEEHHLQMDSQFFEIVTAICMDALQEGNQAKGQNLLSFRQILANLVENGNQILADIDQKMGLQALTADKLLESLLNAQTDEEFTSLVAAGRELLDYEFFQNLTQQIETAQSDGAPAQMQTLKTLRTRILNTTAQLDDEARQMMDTAGKLLQQLLAADDPKPLILNNTDNFDDAFLSLLIANIQQAQQQNNQEKMQKFTTLYTLIMDTLQEQMPPEMQFFNQLLRANTLDAVQTLLNNNRQFINPNFISFLTQVEADMKAEGQTALASRVTAIKQYSQQILG